MVINTVVITQTQKFFHKKLFLKKLLIKWKISHLIVNICEYLNLRSSYRMKLKQKWKISLFKISTDPLCLTDTLCEYLHRCCELCRLWHSAVVKKDLEPNINIKILTSYTNLDTFLIAN